MSAVQGRLRIAMQKSGRLSERSLELLRDAGLRVQRGANDLLFRVENQPIDVLRVRDDDIPTLVADGICDFGVVGGNVLAEFGEGAAERRPVEMMALGFGRCSLKIAVQEATPWSGVGDLQGLRVATSYPGVLRGFLRAHGVSAEVVRMTGSVEVAPRLKVAQAICDLVSTGATLEANGLKAVATVLDSEAVLVRAPQGVAPGLEHVADLLVERLKGVVASQGTKYILMNAPRSRLDEITALLPGAEAPTVTPLAGCNETVAVHAVCQETVFWETLERLKGAGASAILVLPIEKMMP